MFWISLLWQMASQVSLAVMQYEILWWVYKTSGDIGELVIAGILVLLPAALLRGLADMVVAQGNPRASVIASVLLGVSCIAILVGVPDLLAMHDWLLYGTLLIYGMAHMGQTASLMALTRHFVCRNRLQRFDVVSDILELVVLLTVVVLGMVFLSDFPVRWVLFVCMLCSVLALLPVLLLPSGVHAEPELRWSIRYGLGGMVRLASDVIGGVQLVILLGMVLAVLTAYCMVLALMA